MLSKMYTDSDLETRLFTGLCHSKRITLHNKNHHAAGLQVWVYCFKLFKTLWNFIPAHKKGKNVKVWRM